MLKFISKLLIQAAKISDAKLKLMEERYRLSMEQLKEVGDLDPSPNGVYFEWLCKQKKKEGLPDDITELLKEFTKLKNNPSFSKSKDINTYTVQDLAGLIRNQRHLIRQLTDKELTRRILKDGLPGAKLIWNKDGWKCWQVTNPRYAMILGSNTGWCTAHQNHAESYCQKGPLFPIYFEDKPYAQGHVNGEGFVILDKEDDQISVNDPHLMDLLRIDIPPMKMFQNYIANKINLNSITDQNQAIVRELILETSSIVLLQKYLRRFFWEDGWELLMDLNPDMAAQLVSEYDDVQSLLMDHPSTLSEILEAVHLGTRGNLALFCKLNRIADWWNLTCEGGWNYDSTPEKFKEWARKQIHRKDINVEKFVLTLALKFDVERDMITDLILPCWREYKDLDCWKDDPFQPFLEEIQEVAQHTSPVEYANSEEWIGTWWPMGISVAPPDGDWSKVEGALNLEGSEILKQISGWNTLTLGVDQLEMGKVFKPYMFKVVPQGTNAEERVKAFTKKINDALNGSYTKTKVYSDELPAVYTFKQNDLVRMRREDSEVGDGLYRVVGVDTDGEYFLRECQPNPQTPVEGNRENRYGKGVFPYDIEVVPPKALEELNLPLHDHWITGDKVRMGCYWEEDMRYMEAQLERGKDSHLEIDDVDVRDSLNYRVRTVFRDSDGEWERGDAIWTSYWPSRGKFGILPLDFPEDEMDVLLTIAAQHNQPERKIDLKYRAQYAKVWAQVHPTE